MTASQAQEYDQFSSQIQQVQCTYIYTGEKMVNQKLYTCITCNFPQGMCICESCAKVCHGGHDVRPLSGLTGFCDCGAGSCQQKCKCLNGLQIKKPEMPSNTKEMQVVECCLQ